MDMINIKVPLIIGPFYDMRDAIILNKICAIGVICGCLSERTFS